MFKASLSIVVPTHNRKEVLAKALAAYGRQTAREHILEILVVDDGSTDNTVELLSRRAGIYPVPVRVLRQESRGPAAARNLGIKEAGADLILLADDDIIPSPSLVAQHIDWHGRHAGSPIAVLGHVEWAPEVHPTPFMEWLGKDGKYFEYGWLSARSELDFRNFYSCNISLRTDFLRENGVFDEEFKCAAWEDIELGYRLQKRGLKIVYNPDAVGFHYRHISFADVRRRAGTATLASKIFATKEAGVYFSQLKNQDGKELGKPSWAKRPLIFLFKKLLPLFSPLLPILDSQIPLPWPMYRLLYQYFVEADVERRFGDPS
jgi:GT2 family glycosyltransferase